LPPALRWTNPFRIRRQFYEAGPGVSMKLLGRFVKKQTPEVLTRLLQNALKPLFLIQARPPWSNDRAFATPARPPPGRRHWQRSIGRWPRGRWSGARPARRTGPYGTRQYP